MQCNIDAKGRSVRLISGIVCSAIAIGLIVCAALTGRAFWPLLTAGLALLALGAFQIYEGRKGWCIVRAMGFRTPL